MKLAQAPDVLDCDLFNDLQAGATQHLPTAVEAPCRASGMRVDDQDDLFGDDPTGRLRPELALRQGVKLAFRDRGAEHHGGGRPDGRARQHIGRVVHAIVDA